MSKMQKIFNNTEWNRFPYATKFMDTKEETSQAKVTWTSTKADYSALINRSLNNTTSQNEPPVKIPYKTEGFNSLFANMVISQARNSSQDLYDEFLRCDKDKNQILSEEEVKDYTTRNELNGYIGDIKQGHIGDCLLLGHLLAFSQKDWGKKILKDCIKVNDDNCVISLYKAGDWDIVNDRITQLDPIKTEVFVSKEEIEAARNIKIEYPEYKEGMSTDEYNQLCREVYDKTKTYSQGDKDAVAFELAIEKYFGFSFDPQQENIDEYYKDTKNFLFLLTGKKEYIEINMREKSVTDPHSPYICEGMKPNYIEENIIPNQDKYVMIVSFNENKDNMLRRHCYALDYLPETTDGKVILTNPHDSTKKTEIDYDKFINNLVRLMVYKNPYDSDEN